MKINYDYLRTILNTIASMVETEFTHEDVLFVLYYNFDELRKGDIIKCCDEIILPYVFHMKALSDAGLISGMDKKSDRILHEVCPQEAVKNYLHDKAKIKLTEAGHNFALSMEKNTSHTNHPKFSTTVNILELATAITVFSVFE